MLDYIFYPVIKIFNIYETFAIGVKDTINYFLEGKPEKNKIKDNVFLLIEHVCFFSIGVFLFSGEEWLYNIYMMWDYELNKKIILYYVLYTNRYLVQTKMLTGKEKDYTSMLLHHISTILLLTLSFYHYHRIGVIIALTHDTADLFFLPAKICHKFYETKRKKILEILSYILFIIFMITFFLTRIFLNYKIISHVHFKIFEDYESIDLYPESYILFFLLFANLGIQSFWQIMIIKFAYNLISGGNSVDEKGNIYFSNQKGLKNS